MGASDRLRIVWQGASGRLRYWLRPSKAHS